MTIRTRFAPSPTGNLHLGSIRTALYCWLYARHKNGEFILRIEDTDQERSTEAATQLIFDSLEWLGLKYDIGPFYQTKRLEIYRTVAERLLEQGLAYRCYCSKERLNELREKQLANQEKPRYDGYCRDKNLKAEVDKPYVIRFKNKQEGEVLFTDQVLGKLSFQNSELDDLIIIRTDRFPTYNFCVVIDDLEMKVSHVIRGADHINNTPRQINIFHALQAKPPLYAHVPLILGNDGKLLSKRHGAASVLQYRDQGFLPEALLNYLIRLGWSHGNQEIFSLTEMVELFDIKDINKAAASFDPEKLLWLNRHYLKTLNPELIAHHLLPIMQNLSIDLEQGPALVDLIIALRERAETLVELATKGRCFYEELKQYPESVSQYLNSESASLLTIVQQVLEKLEIWSDESLHQAIESVASRLEVKLGKIAQPIRVAVTATTISPPLNVTLRLLGKERTLKRIAGALRYISITL